MFSGVFTAANVSSHVRLANSASASASATPACRMTRRFFISCSPTSPVTDFLQLAKSLRRIIRENIFDPCGFYRGSHAFLIRATKPHESTEEGDERLLQELHESGRDRHCIYPRLVRQSFG